MTQSSPSAFFGEVARVAASAFAHAYLNGGTAYGLGSVEMPGEIGGAAVFRY